MIENLVYAQGLIGQGGVSNVVLMNGSQVVILGMEHGRVESKLESQQEIQLASLTKHDITGVLIQAGV